MPVLITLAAGWRDTFGWFTRALFTPSDPKIAETINDALAALIWVVVDNLAAKLIARFTRSAEARA